MGNISSFLSLKLSYPNLKRQITNSITTVIEEKKKIYLTITWSDRTRSNIYTYIYLFRSYLYSNNNFKNLPHIVNIQFAIQSIYTKEILCLIAAKLVCQFSLSLSLYVYVEE